MLYFDHEQNAPRCATKPEVHVIQDPIRVGWEPIVKVEHYHANAARILATSIEA